MSNGHSPLPLIGMGWTLSLFLVITYLACIALGFVFPDPVQHMVWLQFLPGFTWLSWQSFALGIVETLAYGWFVAVVFVPLYNFFVAGTSVETRQAQRA